MAVQMKCNQCGRCCHKWIISINADDIKRITKLGIKADSFVDFGVGSSITPILKQKKDTGCIFLDKDNLCSIQKKFGYKNKPDVCRHFPYGDCVCGSPEISGEKKKDEIKEKTTFYLVGDKVIFSNKFIEMLGKINTEKPLFDSYANLLFDVMQQKEKILLDSFKLRNHQLRATTNLKRKMEIVTIRSRSKTLFPEIFLLFGGSVKLKLPTREFKFRYNDGKIPEKVQREFIPYLKKEFMNNKSDALYAIKTLMFLYYLPHFAKIVAGDKEINILHTMQAYSMLNGINRFGEINRKDILARAATKLDKLIVKN